MQEDLNPKHQSTANQPIPNLPSQEWELKVSQRLNELYNELIKDLFPHVEKGRAVYFTYHDLALSIINGASQSLHTAFPAPLPKIGYLDPQYVDPDGSKADYEIASLESNSIIFQHIIWAAKIDGKLPKNFKIDSLKNQIVTIEPKATDEYFEMLQEASRYWSRSPEITNSKAAEFLALIYAQESISDSPTFGLARPLSFFLEDSEQGPLIEHGEIIIKQRLLPGSQIFIAGAGLAILSNLNELKNLSKYQFELNDCDPFVSSCLDYFFKLCPQQNIRFTSGKMSAVLSKRADLDFIVLPNVYILNGDNPVNLTNIFSASCKPFSPIHIFQKNTPTDINSTNAEEWEGAMQLAGYSLQVNNNIPLVAGAIEHLDHKRRLELTAKQIKTALNVQSISFYPRKVDHRLIIANTPALQ